MGSKNLDKKSMKKVKCSKCGYEWGTKSDLIMVSCPSCLFKVKIKKNSHNKKENPDMKKIRKIKKWGNSFVIILNSTDMKDFDFEEGDMIDISDIYKIRKKDGKQTK